MTGKMGMIPTGGFYEKGLTPFIVDECKACEDRYQCWLSPCNRRQLFEFERENIVSSAKAIEIMITGITQVSEVNIAPGIVIPEKHGQNHISFKCNLFTIKETWVDAKGDPVIEDGGFWRKELITKAVDYFYKGKLYHDQADRDHRGRERKT